MDIHRHNKELINEFKTALYDIDASVLKDQLQQVFAPDSDIHLAFPFEDLNEPNGLFEGAFKSLLAAIPDLDHRDFIVMAGWELQSQIRRSRCAAWISGVVRMA